ncbi:MAG: response regulator [Phycisphaerales bacterium]|nr:response regulator [Phycisphaerales bacterium]
MRDGKHVILFVDDDPDFRDAMRQMLEANGYEMAEAESAEEGLRLFKRCDPDLIILDLMMEEVDAGRNMLRDLKAEGNTVPVYLLSSMGDNLAMATDTSEMGFAGVFQKPIDQATLLRTLESRLGSPA